jgi:replication factor C subunit 1
MVDSDDGPSKPAPTLKRKNMIVLSSDEEDESVKSPPKKKVAVAAKPAPKAVTSASTSKAAVSRSKPKTNGKVPAKSKRLKDDEFVVDSSEGEAEESSDDYEDEEDVKPAKKVKSKPPVKAKSSPKKVPPQKAPATKAADKDKAKEEDTKPPVKPFKYAHSPCYILMLECHDLVGLLQKRQGSLDRLLLVRNRSLSPRHPTASWAYHLFSRANSAASLETRQ